MALPAGGVLLAATFEGSSPATSEEPDKASDRRGPGGRLSGKAAGGRGPGGSLSRMEAEGVGPMEDFVIP